MLTLNEETPAQEPRGLNRDDIICMAQEAGAGLEKSCLGDPPRLRAISMTPEQIERFAALVAAAEREACKKDKERLDFIQEVARCDPKMDGQHAWWPLSWTACHKMRGATVRDAIDAAIRARGQE